MVATAGEEDGASGRPSPARHLLLHAMVMYFFFFWGKGIYLWFLYKIIDVLIELVKPIFFFGNHLFQHWDNIYLVSQVYEDLLLGRSKFHFTYN